MASPIAQRVLDNLAARVKFVRAQEALGMDSQTVITLQADAAILMMSQQTGITMDDATSVLAELNTQPWTQAQKLAMCSALTRAQEAHGASPGSNTAQQKCPNIEHFLNAEMWAHLRDKNLSWEARADFMGCCLHRLGITIPCEALLKRTVAIALIEGEGTAMNATPHRKRDMAKRIQAAVKARERGNHYPLGRLLVYPARPAHLPEQMQAHAYGDRERPTDTVVPGLDCVAKGVAYRKTHADLREASPSAAASSSDAASAVATSAVAKAIQPFFGRPAEPDKRASQCWS